MEASQPRVKPIRPAEPEQSLGKQSPLPVSGEANVLELPPRPLSVAEPPPVKRKSQTSKSQTSKSQTQGKSASQRKPMMTIRQHWVAHQQLLADEMQQLESQAERINQRLSERAALPALPSSRQAADCGAASPQPETQLPPLEDDEADRLRARLARIHELLAELGTTIASGSSLVEPDEPIDETPQPEAIEQSEAPPLVSPSSKRALECNRSARQTGAAETQADLPPVNLAEQEAVQMAATLRHLAERARSTPSQPTSDLSNFPDLPPSPALMQSQPFQAPVSKLRRSRRQRRLRLTDLLQLPQRPVDRVVDALVWLVISVLGRVAIRLLLVAFPALSPVAIGLMGLPAAIGLLLLLFVPKAGYLPVYRLFLITLGLVLGGKL